MATVSSVLFECSLDEWDVEFGERWDALTQPTLLCGGAVVCVVPGGTGSINWLANRRNRAYGRRSGMEETLPAADIW